MRMFGPNGNPSAKNLFGVLAHLQAQEGREFQSPSPPQLRFGFGLVGQAVPPESRDVLLCHLRILIEGFGMADSCVLSTSGARTVPEPLDCHASALGTLESN